MIPAEEVRKKLNQILSKTKWSYARASEEAALLGKNLRPNTISRIMRRDEKKGWKNLTVKTIEAVEALWDKHVNATQTEREEGMKGNGSVDARLDSMDRRIRNLEQMMLEALSRPFGGGPKERA